MDFKSLGSLIRAARRRKGWDQSELAEKIGVSSAAISKVERGETKQPRDLELIMDTLGVSSAEYKSYLVDTQFDIQPHTSNVISVVESSLRDCTTIIGNKFKASGKEFLMSDPAIQELYINVVVKTVRSKLGMSIDELVNTEFDSKFG